MERSYRASNWVFIYAFLLALTALLLAFEGFARLFAGSTGAGVFLLLLAAAWLACAIYLVLRHGLVRIIIRSDYLNVKGDGPERRVAWSDVERVREFRGPAYQLSLRGLLPGPYFPHSLVRGETVLALDFPAATRLLFRQALVDSYGAFRQEVIRSVGRDVEVDLHARWWRLDAPGTRASALPDDDGDDDDPDDEADREARAILTRQANRTLPPARRDRGDGGGFRR